MTSTIIARGRRFLERLQQLVRGRLVESETLGVEQHDHLALALDRAARHLVDDGLRVLDADLGGRRVDLDDVGVHARGATRSHARSSPSGAMTAAAKHRAASSIPEPRGPDEQVRVHRALGGALQLRDGAVLADDLSPTLGRSPAMAVILPATGRPRPRTRSADVVERRRSRRPRPTRARRASSRYAAPHRSVELGALALEPVGLDALTRGGDGVGDVEHDHEIGLEPLRSRPR